VEAGLTFLLLLVILGTADRHRVIGEAAAVGVGATIALCGLIGLPITGASMNPARSLGPAIANLDLGNAWIYLVGPVTGGLAALGLTRLLRGDRRSEDAQAVAQGTPQGEGKGAARDHRAAQPGGTTPGPGQQALVAAARPGRRVRPIARIARASESRDG
jgi:aquaporin Z